jgi:hypothetical protein
MSKTNLYFSTVQALPDNSVVLGGHLVVEGSSPTATLVIHFVEDKWRLLAKVPDVVNALALGRRLGNEQVLAVLGREGFFAEVSVRSRELLTETRVPIEAPGYMEDVVFWREDYYVCGAHRQVHRFNGRIWDRVDRNIYRPAGIPNEFMLSLHTADLLYACGSRGFVASFDSRSWEHIASPTNVDLNTVFCAADGRVMLAGGGGLLFTILPDGTLDQIAEGLYPDAIFWDIEAFQGAIYLAAGKKIFKLEGELLEQIRLPFAREVEAYSLSSSSKSLWLVGDEYVYEFTGGRWLEHQSPSNRQ